MYDVVESDTRGKLLSDINLFSTVLICFEHFMEPIFM